MARATAMHIRELIVREKTSGKSLTSISRDHQLSYSTVYSIWRRYEKRGIEGLGTDYSRCGPQGVKTDYMIYRSALWLKRLHPNWGAPYIKTLLEQRHPNKEVPIARTMQIWFGKQSYRKPRFTRPKPNSMAVKAPHDCWQIDAKERLTLEDQTPACYLTVVDVKSGAALDAPVFSL